MYCVRTALVCERTPCDVIVRYGRLEEMLPQFSEYESELTLSSLKMEAALSSES